MTTQTCFTCRALLGPRPHGPSAVTVVAASGRPILRMFSVPRGPACPVCLLADLLKRRAAAVLVQ